MTFERASELVSALRDKFPPPDLKAVDLFNFFVDTFKLTTEDQLVSFAEMCGFLSVTHVERAEPSRDYIPEEN